MDTSTACDVVNHLHFRPGWKFSAEEHYDPGHIWVDAAVDTVDTNDYPNYTEKLTLHPVFKVDVRRLDVDGLLFEILRRIHTEFDQHEDREFLRVDTGYGRHYCPFHPHDYMGRERWDFEQSHLHKHLQTAA